MKTVKKNVVLKYSRKTAISKQAYSVACPFCSREFVGNKAKLRDKIKCHLGFKHFVEEIDEEAKIFFGKDDKCKDCGRIFKKHTKRKHLTFNHS